MIRQAIEQRGRQLFVARKDRDPFGEGEIRGDDGGATLVAIGEKPATKARRRRRGSARAARKLGQYAARKVGHLQGVHSTCF